MTSSVSMFEGIFSSSTKPVWIDGQSVEVVRTNRKKTASIKVEDGKIQVFIPKRYPDKKLQELIDNKTPWIREKLRIQSEVPPTKPKEYVSGESFTYLGRNYRLKLTQDLTFKVKLRGGQLVLGVDQNLPGDQREDFIRGQLVRWYQEHAEQRLKDKTSRYSKVLGVKPKSVTLKDYKSRWGSCSSNGDISYNWKIIIAPHRIIDYVVVHELCHMHQHNHSPAFWKLVERVFSDYKESRQWLKVNGVNLVV